MIMFDFRHSVEHYRFSIEDQLVTQTSTVDSVFKSGNYFSDHMFVITIQ